MDQMGNEELLNDEIKFYISQLKFTNFFCKKIIRYNRQLEELKEEFYTIQSIDYTKIPSSGGTPHFNKLHFLMSKEDELIKKREKYAKKIEEINRTFSILPEDVQVMVTRLYVLRENHEKVAYELGYTRRGMYKRINASLYMALM